MVAISGVDVVARVPGRVEVVVAQVPGRVEAKTVVGWIETVFEDCQTDGVIESSRPGEAVTFREEPANRTPPSVTES